MDVTNIISKFRSEREEIDQAIRFLENGNGNVNLGARTLDTTIRCVEDYIGASR
jgi:hypothetical protein